MEPRDLNKAVSCIKGCGDSGANLAKINSFAMNAAKLNGCSLSATKLNACALNASKLTFGAANIARHRSVESAVKPIGKGARIATGMLDLEGRPYQQSNLWSKQLVPPELSQSQRGWLSKGIRSWALQAEARPDPQLVYLDLFAFLRRRHLEANQKRFRWSGGGSKRAEIWTWLTSLRRRVLPRLTSGIDPAAASKELLAVLAAPPGWTTAARFRLVLESLIPTTLERLAEVIAPNAPSSLDPPRHFLIEAGAVPSH